MLLPEWDFYCDLERPWNRPASVQRRLFDCKVARFAICVTRAAIASSIVRNRSFDGSFAAMAWTSKEGMIVFMTRSARATSSPRNPSYPEIIALYSVPRKSETGQRPKRVRSRASLPHSCQNCLPSVCVVRRHTNVERHCCYTQSGYWYNIIYYH